MNANTALAAKDGLGNSVQQAEANPMIAAMAEAQRAAIQSRIVMAMQRPRNRGDFRQKVLEECRRPEFAEVARYKRPVGKEYNKDTDRWEEKIAEGPSIRFIEMALREYGNAGSSVVPLYDDQRRRAVSVEVWDYEKNFSFATVVELAKTVERRELRRGQKAISVRENSYGETVYIIEATEDQWRTKEAALVSKAIRENGRRILPGDIVEEGQKQAVATQLAKVKEDPQRERLALEDGFAKLGVKPSELQEYLGGRALDGLSPEELVELRAVYQGMKDFGLRWPDVLEASPYVKRDAKADDKPDAKVTRLRDQIEKTKASLTKKKTTKPAAAPKSEPPPENAAPAPAAEAPPAEAPADPERDGR